MKLPEDEYWSKVIQGEEPDDCWGWTGGFSNFGHGKITFNNKQSTIHRLSYILHYGSIPEGKFILHSCDNPPCSNPLHLRVGTQKDNMQDAFKRDRKGKLSMEDRRNILKEYRCGGTTTRKLASEWGVGKSTIWSIVTNNLSFDLEKDTDATS
jgi:hypothetical protein